jgi:hypothetical protein
VRDFELTDTSRLDVLFAARTDRRRLALRVWYPAGDTDGYQLEPYATPAELETTFPAIASEELGMPSFFYSDVKHIDTHAYRDANLGAELDAQRRAALTLSGHLTCSTDTGGLLRPGEEDGGAARWCRCRCERRWGRRRPGGSRRRGCGRWRRRARVPLR